MNWKLFFDRRRKSPQEEIDLFSKNLQEKLGSSVKSMIVFGSVASGEYQSGRSNINLLIVFDNINLEVLSHLQGVLAPWLKRGHPWPILLEQDELLAFARSCPIEFLDLQDYHRVILGTDVMTSLSVPTGSLRFQCENELALKLLKLRQSFITCQNRPAEIRNLLVRSISSILTLFRAILRLDEKVQGLGKLQAAERLAQKVGGDPNVLRRIYELHLRRQSDNIQDIAQHYLELIEDVYKTLINDRH